MFHIVFCLHSIPQLGQRRRTSDAFDMHEEFPQMHGVVVDCTFQARGHTGLMSNSQNSPSEGLHYVLEEGTMAVMPDEALGQEGAPWLT